MVNKKDIRERIFVKRAQLSGQQIEADSKIIIDKLLRLEGFIQSDTIFTYVGCKGEVATKLLIEKAFLLKKKVAVPKVYNKIMEFYYITNWEDLAPGGFGLLEPTTTQLANLDPEKALMVMPGVAFDHERNRIGYGGGYYDRYLAAHPCQTVALAFDFQVLEKVEAEIFDLKPDLIITEKGEIGRN